MRRIAIALVALLALTGCAEIGSLTDKAQIDLALQSLTSDLADLGVVTESTAELTPEYSYVVSVRATADDLSEPQLIDVAVRVDEQLGGGVFAGLPVSFELRSSQGTALAITDFTPTPQQLDTDIAYGLDVGAAYGAPATIFIGAGTLGHPYSLSVGVQSSTAPQSWDAVRAVRYDGDAAVSSSFPGLSYEGDFPPVEATDLVTAIGAITPLLTVSEEVTADSFATMDWYSADRTVSYVPTGLDVENPTASSSWPTTVAIARLILDAGVGPVTLTHYPLNGSGHSAVALGDCTVLAEASTADTALATALSAALGVVVQPGICGHA